MKLFFKISIMMVSALCAENLYAQRNKEVPIKKIPVKSKTTDSSEVKKRKDSISYAAKWKQQMDVTDLLQAALHIKPGTQIDSVTSKPTFSVIPAVGYTLVSKFAVVVSGNAAFRTGPKSRISAIVASTSFTQNRQFTLPVQSSIWSKNNDYNFVGDFRFYRYPQSTFGLGSSANITHEDPMDYAYVQIYETVLRHITGNLYLGGGYIIDDHWNITDKGDFNDYAKYGKVSRSIASGVTLNALLDSRDNAINPFKGAYVSFQYRDNYKFLGSDNSWQSLIIDVRKYVNFPAGSGNVLAFWSYNWLTLSGRPAYLDLPSTQWDAFSATGRGYIQGRFRGAQMVYGETEYRYKILDNGLLGGVFFLNAESFSAAPGTKLQGIQPGYGPGLRLKINKISKTNISFDYGFGRQGSRGLFIDIGEIF